ncbi:MAG: 5'/3'-nucleotidase SurE [Trueperaceae bacterium]
MKILVSNDDGIFSPGILALAKAMCEIADEVLVVAPDVEQSAVGHGITVRHPLRYKETALDLPKNARAYRVDGTPADCVVLGVLSEEIKPDVVVSGVNLGSNLGYDVTHSGTVAAALEGMTLGIPSIAFSLRSKNGDFDFSHAVTYAGDLVPQVAKYGLPARTLLNINIPVGTPKGVRLARQSTHSWEDTLIKREDPYGLPYYWVSGVPTAKREPDTDYTAVEDGFISVTPLYFDMTYHSYFAKLAEFVPGLEQV